MLATNIAILIGKAIREGKYLNIAYKNKGGERTQFLSPRWYSSPTSKMIEEGGNCRLVEIEGEGWLDRKNIVCMLEEHQPWAKMKKPST
jgi:hypothetical protein